MAATAVSFAPPTRATSETTDRDLVAAVRRGDDYAFERLYERYHRRIAAYIYGMVNDYGRAEDIAQDVFMSSLRRMRETDRPIAFKPWIYEIAKNACIDQFRRSRRAEEISYDAEAGMGAADYGRLVMTGPSPDAAVDTKMSMDHLRGAFGGLSETHHKILVMRELEGLSYREIGERMGMSRPSVESTLFRARRRLSEEYEELVSGERCTRVQAIIAAAAEGILGTRDQRKLAKHVSHCQSCRREARVAGLEAGTLAARPVRARVAAFLPLPAFLRRRFDSDDAGLGSSSITAGHHSTFIAQWSAQLSATVDPAIAGWAKAAVAAVAVAVAGVGAGSAASVQRDELRPMIPSRGGESQHRSAPGADGAAASAPARVSREGIGRRPSGALTGTAPQGQQPRRGEESAAGRPVTTESADPAAVTDGAPIDTSAVPVFPTQSDGTDDPTPRPQSGTPDAIQQVTNEARMPSRPSGGSIDASLPIPPRGAGVRDAAERAAERAVSVATGSVGGTTLP